MAAYQNPEEAQAGLASAFSPSTPQQDAAIKQAAALVPGSSTTSSSSTPSPYYPRYTESAAEQYLNTFTPPESEESIVARKTAAAQGQIDSLRQLERSMLAEQQVINDQRDRSTASVNTLSGLAGSTEANVQQQKTTAINQKDNERIKNEVQARIQGIFSDIRKSAIEEARQSRLDARDSATASIAARAKRQEQATTQLTQLAQSGVTAVGLKSSDRKSYDYFVKAFGSEEQVNALFTLNRPVDQILDKRVEGGKYVIAYQNPLTGQIRIESVDLGLPPQYSKTIDAGNRILAIPDNWDGDPSKLITINKGLTPKEALDRAGTDGLNQSASSISLVKDSITKALSHVDASGRSGMRRTAEAWFWGSTDYSNLEAETNTIRTNVLTLTTDPDVKKFFGPQMSNADVKLMTSAGTTLNPELQSPDQMKAELLRLQDLMSRMDAAVAQGKGQTSTGISGNNVITAPDGTQVEIID